MQLRHIKAVTFDCYGTLIDWDTGVANVLGPWAVRTGFVGTVSDLIAAFAVRQQAQQRLQPFKGYRSILRDALAEAVDSVGGAISRSDLDAFADSVGDWPAFPDTIDALRHLKAAGLHIGVLSNVDSASFEATHRRLGGLIDTVITADEVGAYKPDLKMFQTLLRVLDGRGISRQHVVHLAQSRFHDVAPARELGLDVVWIDRRHGRPGHGIAVASAAEPTARFAHLEAFCATLATKAA